MSSDKETAGRIEPCHFEAIPAKLADLAVELGRAADRLGKRLHPTTTERLAWLVRVMNCYYSNLIEGHKTHPRDIERALESDFTDDPKKRNLQIEAKAHIEVQMKIDRLAREGKLGNTTSRDFIRWLHDQFYRNATPEMLLIGEDDRAYSMMPGRFRMDPEHDVIVGQHQPPSSGRVEDFMEHFEHRFRMDALGDAQKILSIAIVHHRFNYIHPFPDGNGRVSRLMSHAMGHTAGIGAGGLWSISRGLARGLQGPADYKQMMAHADAQRMSDLDGRGNLSEKALVDYVEWFLKVCLDQITYMGKLFELERLEQRLKLYVETEEGLHPVAFKILQEALIRGEMARGDAARATGMSPRSARVILGSLLERGMLGSDTPKGPVSLRFPVHSLEILFPNLFAPLLGGGAGDTSDG